jgi:Flp pilus assembly protein protease CpaA
MEEYIFLFILAGIWLIFGTIQDIRTREVANWLNFSLIAIALAYRLFYSVVYNKPEFFIYGLAGVVLFFGLANLFYYGKVFGGGDAKLLIGLGAIFPFENFLGLISQSAFFIIALFTFGSIWGILYSGYLSITKRDNFKKEFKKIAKSRKRFYLVFSFLILILNFVGYNFHNERSLFYLGILISSFPWIYLYLKAVEKGCLIVLVKPDKLTEGDWIERDIKVNGKWIRKNVHGLNKRDIILLRRAKKSIWIKEGIPFVPAFLLAYIIMALFFFFLPIPILFLHF